MSEPLLQVSHLKKWFPITKGIFSRTVGHVKAVDDVSFHLHRGETLGLVGESGCGKTTAGRTLLRLIEPTEGQASFDGQALFGLEADAMRALRRKMQIIFQDPYSSLNPRLNVETAIGEPLKVHGIASGSALRDRVVELVEKVGLLSSHLGRFPHEFSGGQRQRIGIARALALNPEFIVCDEAVSALDVSIQAQVINLLRDLQQEMGLSYLFIAHDLSVVKHISDRIAVMYLGKIVETATTDDLFASPRHPYTQALLQSVPIARARHGKKIKRRVLTGDVPSPIDPPSGCPFHTRCPLVHERCKTEVPATHTVATGHTTACHLYEDQREQVPLSRAET